MFARVLGTLGSQPGCHSAHAMSLTCIHNNNKCIFPATINAKTIFAQDGLHKGLFLKNDFVIPFPMIFDNADYFCMCPVIAPMNLVGTK